MFLGFTSWFIIFKTKIGNNDDNDDMFFDIVLKKFIKKFVIVLDSDGEFIEEFVVSL